MTLIDSHTHLFFEDFRADLDAVLQRAHDAGVVQMVVPGTDLPTSRQAVELADRYPQIFACVGFHPHDAAKADGDALRAIDELSRHPKVVAIGEIGLDFYYDHSPRGRQHEVFDAQLDLASVRGLPVVVHTRESTPETLGMVRSAVERHPEWLPGTGTPARGVFHCFPGTGREAIELWGLGFYVSYPGVVTFKKSNAIEAIREIGAGKILVETDAPYLSPVPLRGRRNEPANVLLIARFIAEACGVPLDAFAVSTTRNARELFRLPPMNA
jgi:TatD DNase family protein